MRALRVWGAGRGGGGGGGAVSRTTASVAEPAQAAGVQSKKLKHYFLKLLITIYGGTTTAILKTQA